MPVPFTSTKSEKWRTGERRRRLKCYYGITLEDWDRMFQEQNGVCAVCKQSKKLVVDHNHTTKKVRGLLCNYCNILLGMIDKDKTMILNALKYQELR